MEHIKNLMKNSFIWIPACLLFVVFVIVAIFSNIHIGNAEKYVLDQVNPEQSARIGIVFGSGVAPNGQPFEELQARLDTAANALDNGTVEKLVLSGDNRVESYNEPTAMLAYLVDKKGIDESVLQPDFAGRSTYETCERASKIFSLDKAILFSADSHLPRAIFTCRSFGIESYGIGNDVEANNATRRELLARMKAIFNVYIYGEETILGEPIEL